MIILLLSLLLSSPAHATDENRGWLGVFSRKASEAKTHFTHQELQLRYNFEDGSNQQLLARFGFLKPLNESHEVGLLLGYIETGDLVEYRPTLQHIYTRKGESGSFALRTRLEWRDWEDRGTNSIRSRFLLSYLRPLTTSYSLFVWDEPFINLTNDTMSGERVLERNRLFLGVKFSAIGHTFDVGYLNQFVPRQKDLTEHIAVLYTYF